MTDKLPATFNCYSNYLNILKNFRTDGQQQISQYSEIDRHHTHILNNLTLFGKNAKKLTPTDEKEMEKILRDSLDLSEKKVNISGCLMNMVSENNLKLNMNFKDLKMTQVIQNKPNESHKIMLEPSNEEMESDTIDVLNVDNSNEHSNNNKTTQNKNFQMNVDSNVQTIFTDTNENVKNTAVDKNSRTQSFYNSRRISSSSDISDILDDSNDVQPTYCICEKISYGVMICCDNDLCPIEWFHFGCVSLSRKPKGKWYCPNCRGANSKIMKPREIFFKELKEYNKRKEEDW